MNNTNTSNKDQPSKFNGSINQAAGTVKENVGQAFGNDKMKAEGTVQAAEGRAEKAGATLNDKIKKGAQVVGDAVERAGDKLADAGLSKIGAAVHKAGDKIEHSRD